MCRAVPARRAVPFWASRTRTLCRKMQCPRAASCRAARRAVPACRAVPCKMFRCAKICRTVPTCRAVPCLRFRMRKMCRAVSACRACVPRHAKYAMPCRALLARNARVPCRARVPRCENVPCRAEPAYSAASGRARVACLACDPRRDKCALCSPRVPCPRAAPRRACVPRCATCDVPCPRAVPAVQVAQHVPCRSRAVPYLRSRARNMCRAVHECSAVPAWRAMPASIRKELSQCDPT